MSNTHLPCGHPADCLALREGEPAYCRPCRVMGIHGLCPYPDTHAGLSMGFGPNGATSICMTCDRPIELPKCLRRPADKEELYSARLEGARLALIVAPPRREGHLCACCAKMKSMKPEEIVKP